jgi:hypothetical protein
MQNNASAWSVPREVRVWLSRRRGAEEGCSFCTKAYNALVPQHSLGMQGVYCDRVMSGLFVTCVSQTHAFMSWPTAPNTHAITHCRAQSLYVNGPGQLLQAVKQQVALLQRRLVLRVLRIGPVRFDHTGHLHTRPALVKAPACDSSRTFAAAARCTLWSTAPSQRPCDHSDHAGSRHGEHAPCQPLQAPAQRPCRERGRRARALSILADTRPATMNSASSASMKAGETPNACAMDSSVTLLYASRNCRASIQQNLSSVHQHDH